MPGTSLWSSCRRRHRRQERGKFCDNGPSVSHLNFLSTDLTHHHVGNGHYGPFVLLSFARCFSRGRFVLPGSRTRRKINRHVCSRGTGNVAIGLVSLGTRMQVDEHEKGRGTGKGMDDRPGVRCGRPQTCIWEGGFVWARLRLTSSAHVKACSFYASLGSPQSEIQSPLIHASLRCASLQSKSLRCNSLEIATRFWGLNGCHLPLLGSQPQQYKWAPSVLPCPRDTTSEGCVAMLGFRAKGVMHCAVFCRRGCGRG